jgi:hypothetical protein
MTKRDDPQTAKRELVRGVPNETDRLLQVASITPQKIQIHFQYCTYRRTRSLRIMQPKRIIRKGYRTYSPASYFDLIPT